MIHHQARQNLIKYQKSGQNVFWKVLGTCSPHTGKTGNRIERKENRRINDVVVRTKERSYWLFRDFNSAKLPVSFHVMLRKGKIAMHSVQKGLQFTPYKLDW